MNKTHIVISVKAKYAVQILAGNKTVELRRRRVHVEPGSRVWIYVTAPEARVAAVATVSQVVTGRPHTIWRQHRASVGVSWAEFEAYFTDCESACAIILCDVQAIAPALHLSELRRKSKRFHPPQFFKRLQAGSAELRLLQSASR
jgi:predicted transcriptional regulator